MSEEHNNHGSGKHSGCEHGHDDTKLPRGFLVAASGLLTGIGLALEWFSSLPQIVATIAFALATIAGGLLVFPAAWKALLKKLF